MLAVSSLQDTWPMLIGFSVVLHFLQQVDRFNDRARRPIPGASNIWRTCGCSARGTSPLNAISSDRYTRV
jgi:hypothetical protein